MGNFGCCLACEQKQSEIKSDIIKIADVKQEDIKKFFNFGETRSKSKFKHKANVEF